LFPSEGRPQSADLLACPSRASGWLPISFADETNTVLPRAATGSAHSTSDVWSGRMDLKAGQAHAFPGQRYWWTTCASRSQTSEVCSLMEKSPWSTFSRSHFSLPVSSAGSGSMCASVCRD